MEKKLYFLMMVAINMFAIVMSAINIAENKERGLMIGVLIVSLVCMIFHSYKLTE